MICYEWIVEELEDGGSDSDIIDTNGYPTLAEARSHADSIITRGGVACIGLVRDVGNEWDGLTDRQWAYLNADGALPDEFDDGVSIPRRFFKEAAA